MSIDNKVKVKDFVNFKDENTLRSNLKNILVQDKDEQCSEVEEHFWENIVNKYNFIVKNNFSNLSKEFNFFDFLEKKIFKEDLSIKEEMRIYYCDFAIDKISDVEVYLEDFEKIKDLNKLHSLFHKFSSYDSNNYEDENILIFIKNNILNIVFSNEDDDNSYIIEIYSKITIKDFINSIVNKLNKYRELKEQYVSIDMFGLDS